jgi:hypothetical protein
MVKKNGGDMLKDREETIRQLEFQLSDRQEEAD